MIFAIKKKGATTIPGNPHMSMLQTGGNVFSYSKRPCGFQQLRQPDLGRVA